MSDRKIIKEFLGAIFKKIAANRGRAFAKRALNSPGMKKIAKDADKLSYDIRKSQEKAAANGDPVAKDILKIMRDMGI